MVDRELLRAYIKLISTGRPVGVREFQRIMGYRSPGKSKYVLDRMVRYGLAVRGEDGKYYPAPRLPPELSEYIVLRGTLIPRILVYGVSTLSFVTIFSLLSHLDPYITLALYIPVAPYFIEALRLYRRLKSLVLEREK